MRYIFIINLLIGLAYAENIQSFLMDIAVEEAKIAHIGYNKINMLYGLNNPLSIIKRWHQIENHQELTIDEINQINLLEQKKQQFLNGN